MTSNQMNTDAPRWLRRTVLVLVFVPAIVAVVVKRIWLEIKFIPFYVKVDVSETWRDAKELWR